MTTGPSLQSSAISNRIPNQSPSLLQDNAPAKIEPGQFWAALRRNLGWVLGLTVSTTAAVAVAGQLRPAQYQAQFSVLVQPIATAPATGPTGLAPVRMPSPVTADLLTILSSRKLIAGVLDELAAEDPQICDRLGAKSAQGAASTPEEGCYQAVAQTLTLSTLEAGSNIIQVSYQGRDPAAIAQFLDRLSEAYLGYSLESQQADVRRQMHLVDKKLPELQRRVQTLQDQLQQLRSQYKMVTPEQLGAQLSRQVGDFTQQQRQAQVELEETRSLYENLVKQLRQPEKAASSALKQNPRYQSLLDQLVQLDARIAQTSALTSGSRQKMQEMRQQRRNLLKILAREGGQSQRQLVNQMQELESREQILRETIEGLNQEVQELSRVSRVYSDIQRELKASTDGLNQLRTQQAALETTAAQQQIPWELLAPPNNPAPRSNELGLNLLRGSLFGFLLGLIVALMVDRLADLIHTAEDLRQRVRLPLLGVIPFSSALKDGRSLMNPALLPRGESEGQRGDRDRAAASMAAANPAVVEAFRSLYANLRLRHLEPQVRSLVVSSTSAQEGKSTVAIGLAEAAAALGQRVLLVDANLRSPRLHQLLNLSNSQGLTNVIQAEVALRTVLQRSPLEPNLYVLTAGTVVPDPTRLLASAKMQQLMEQVQISFDWVIYDAPSLFGMADVYILAAGTSGVLLVAAPGRVKPSRLKQVMQQMQVSSTLVLGLVIQQAQTKRH